MVQRKRAAIDAPRSRAFRRDGDERARGVAGRGARGDVGGRRRLANDGVEEGARAFTRTADAVLVFDVGGEDVRVFSFDG